MPHSPVNARDLKFGRIFDLIDVDHDGITILSDWQEFAGYMCSQFRESIDSPTGDWVLEAVLSWWCTILGRVAGYDDRELTRTAFVAYYRDGTVAELGPVIHQHVDAVFALCDGDADGRLSRREFAGVLRVHGVPEDELARTMRHMIAHDPTISRDAYTELVTDFCLSGDARLPGSWLFGKV
jgi:Ca2+-binding EF-hand superfamily protein